MYQTKYQDEFLQEDTKRKKTVVKNSEEYSKIVKERVDEFSNFLYKTMMELPYDVAQNTFDVLETDVQKLDRKKNNFEYKRGDIVSVELPNRRNMVGSEHLCVILNKINDETYKIVPVKKGKDKELQEAYHSRISPEGDKKTLWLLLKDYGFTYNSVAKVSESLTVNSGDIRKVGIPKNMFNSSEGKNVFLEMSHYIAVLENGAQYDITARNREIIMLRQQNKEQKQQLEGVMKLTQKLNYLSSENDSLKIQHEKDKDIILDKNIQITALESEVEKHKAEYLESLEKLANLKRIIEQEVLDSKQKFEKLQNDYNQLNEYYNNLSSNVQELGYEVDNYGNISVLEYSYDIEH